MIGNRIENDLEYWICIASTLSAFKFVKNTSIDVREDVSGRLQNLMQERMLEINVDTIVDGVIGDVVGSVDRSESGVTMCDVEIY